MEDAAVILFLLGSLPFPFFFFFIFVEEINPTPHFIRRLHHRIENGNSSVGNREIEGKLAAEDFPIGLLSASFTAYYYLALDDGVDDDEEKGLCVRERISK